MLALKLMSVYVIVAALLHVRGAAYLTGARSQSSWLTSFHSKTVAISLGAGGPCPIASAEVHP
jgi:hypothetical protein